MQQTTEHFKQNAHAALQNPALQRALSNIKTGFVGKCKKAIENLPEFDQLRDAARDMKNHVLMHLDFYLETFADQVTALGGKVHWANTATDANDIILKICQSVNAKCITKGKSMMTEEIGLNAHLEKAGQQVIETDLGEYIIQLRNEPPSHIVAPAIHLTQEEITADFYHHHTDYDAKRSLAEPENLVAEARAILREKYGRADVGITGANFLIAENGATAIVTNEGNGDLTQTLAKVHIVVAGIEKVIPTMEDASLLIRLLPRSATGQEITSYVTFSFGPKRLDDYDGPEQFHVVLIDNKRSDMLQTELQDMLRCIRCGACMNHCPVYGGIGGHAYGWVYPGPMGAVLTPHLTSITAAHDLPNASTFCGRCEAVCPVHIPLPNMMRTLRKQEFEKKIGGMRTRFALALWVFIATKPKLYNLFMQRAIAVLHFFGKRKGRFRFLPLAQNWTQHRDFPVPSGKTFQEQWKKYKKPTDD
jgi:L-lactate dehydrogenase complex protein LldF